MNLESLSGEDHTPFYYIEVIEDLMNRAQELAATVDLLLHDAHPIYGSTTKWYGGIGGQTITSHCSITQGPHPGGEWTQYDYPSAVVRDFLQEYPFDLATTKKIIIERLNARYAADMERENG